MLLDKALLDAMERLFQDTEARVITAVKVSSRAGASGLQWTTSKSRRPPPGKARILCLTAKRSKSSHGYRCTLHVVKQSEGGGGGGGDATQLQIRKSMALKFLSRMEALRSAGEGDDSEAVLALTFASAMGTGLAEGRVTYGVPTEDDRSLLLACLYQLSTEHDRCTPAVLGVDVADLTTLSRTEKALALLGEFGAELLTPEEQSLSAERSAQRNDASGDGQAAISSKEERDLKGLMESFKVGIGDVEEFMERLDDELKALEAANVHSILEGHTMVEGVLKRLGMTLHLLEDMEAQMSVYNFRLQHLRDDISAIELRNNRLEIAAQNSAALLDTLRDILGHLTLPDDTENQLLIATDFGELSERRLAKVVDCAWQLERTLRELEPGGEGSLSEGLLRMRAVRERKAQLTSNAHQFVRRAAAFLVGRFQRIEDSFSPPEVQAAFKRGILSNTELHSTMRAFVPLVEVMKALEPASLAQLRSEYVRAANSLVRKQMRACTAMMKAAVRTANAQAAPEAGLNTRRGPRRKSSFSLMAGGSLRLRRRGSAMSSMGMGSPSPVTSPSTSASAPLSTSPSKKMATLSALPSLMLGPLHDVEARSLDDAYAALLDTFVPLLLKEADFAVDLLLLGSVVESGREGAREGALSRPPARPARARQLRVELEAGAEKVLAALLEGVQAELLALAELAGKSGLQQAAIPMLGATLRQQARAAAASHAPALLAALTECERRLRAHFETYIGESEATIRRFEPRRAMRSGSRGKHVHVAPFVENFGLFVTRMEDLIWAFGSEELAAGQAPTNDAVESDAESQSQASAAIGFGGARAAEGALSRAGGPSRRTTADTVSSVDMDSEESGTPVASAGPGGRVFERAPSYDAQLSLRARFVGTGGAAQTATTQVRNLMDDAYRRLIAEMIATIERLAKEDAKYGNKLRLENYSMLIAAVESQAASVPILAHFALKLAGLKETAIRGYVQEQLQYCRMWALLNFSEQLDLLLPDVGADEVRFQMHFAPDDLSRLLNDTMLGVEKKLGLMYGRIAKHFAFQRDEFIAMVWSRCTMALLRRYQRLEEQVAACYPALRVRPSAEELQVVLGNTTPQLREEAHPGAAATPNGR